MIKTPGGATEGRRRIPGRGKAAGWTVWALAARGAILSACLGCVLLAVLTRVHLRPVPDSLDVGKSAVRRVQVFDRHGVPLTVTYENPWNLNDTLPVHEIPLLFQRAFVESEDRRFFSHGGVDWVARGHALFQNAVAGRAVRGASTITEQVVRMLHPRPRTVWSRWLEGFEASALETRFPKAAILEFYLNQVPYGRRRRGVLQASRLYFGRDLDTLSLREMLALTVLVRAPGGMDLARPSSLLDRSCAALARRLAEQGAIGPDQYAETLAGGLTLRSFPWPIDAGHFVQYLLRSPEGSGGLERGKLTATLDGSIQRVAQTILDRRLQDLEPEGVRDGAVLVVDHQGDEILAWVNGGGLSGERPGGWIDAVTVRRQPGSTLKPFLYGLALEMGWTAATPIDDSPLAEPIGDGLHAFRNYSGVHYGPLRLREALGNSLNIPALRAIRFTGTNRFLERLHALGMLGLDRPSEFYGEGLALGDGEVSLLELVGAYAVLARGGVHRPLRGVLQPDSFYATGSRRVFDEAIASLLGSILSDPEARRLEFGASNVLSLPVQTAVKTGTSSDHRDAWAVGFSATHTVGVWMGNLDRRPTRSVTGTTGPGLVLRALFAELNRSIDPRPLRLSSTLVSVPVCRVSGLGAGPGCPRLDEWFLPGTAPGETCPLHGTGAGRDSESRVSEFSRYRMDQPEKDRRERNAVTPRPPGKERPTSGRVVLEQPTDGLRLAMDPHVPDELEAFALRLAHSTPVMRTEWLVDGVVVGRTGPEVRGWLWPMSRGAHRAQARVWLPGLEEPVETGTAAFEVR